MEALFFVPSPVKNGTLPFIFAPRPPLRALSEHAPRLLLQLLHKTRTATGQALVDIAANHGQVFRLIPFR